VEMADSLSFNIINFSVWKVRDGNTSCKLKHIKCLVGFVFIQTNITEI